MQKTAETEALSEGTREQLANIAAADVVVGLPTFENRETIDHVAQAALAALTDRLSAYRCAIVNADGGSHDGCDERLRQTAGAKVPLLQVRYPMYPVRKLSTPLAGVPGLPEAVATIFPLALELKARACVVLDADVESLTPEWIERLCLPVLNHEMDMVEPCYVRHKFDGLIGGGIVSPFYRALYGRRVRLSVGADFGFSSRLMEFYAGREASNSDGTSPADPLSAAAAACHGFRIGQTLLGPRVTHARETQPDLSDVLSQVLAAMFERMEKSVVFWQKVRGSEPCPWYGPPLEVNDGPAEVNLKRMIDSFRLGCQDLLAIWGPILAPATLFELRKMLKQPEDKFRFADDVWARTVYDFALGYHMRTIGRDHLLKAMTPLYLGWAASFLSEIREARSAEVEDRLERIGAQFEAQKKYLISRWRWPDRFNP